MPNKYRVIIICNVVAGSTNILNIVDACIIVIAITSMSILKEKCIEQLFIINEFHTIYNFISKDGSKHIYEVFA